MSCASAYCWIAGRGMLAGRQLATRCRASATAPRWRSFDKAPRPRTRPPELQTQADAAMAARYDAETLVLEWEERLVARHIECSSPLPGQNHVGPRANHIASTEDGCRPRREHWGH